MNDPVTASSLETPSDEVGASRQFLTVMSLAAAGLALFVTGLALPFLHGPFREVFAGKQSRGEVPVDAELLAQLDRLEAERCGNA